MKRYKFLFNFFSSLLIVYLLSSKNGFLQRIWMVKVIRTDNFQLNPYTENNISFSEAPKEPVNLYLRSHVIYNYPGRNKVLTDSVYLADDCLLYPVSKSYALPENFVPSSLVAIGDGSIYLRSEAADALKQLFDAASANSYTFSIKSGYRSESVQAKIFNYWVTYEMSLGYSYSEAVERAGAYSARPRHSEHQLGTAVDIVIPRLGEQFTQLMWSTPEIDWLKRHLHEYGFVISYPQGKEELTGYTAEPWHIRWIGVDHATALYNLGYLDPKTPVTLTSYLLELAH